MAYLKKPQPSNESGQALVEYALLTALLSIVVMGVLVLFGEEIANALDELDLGGGDDAEGQVEVYVHNASARGIPNVAVYAFTSDNTYTQINQTTNDRGKASFDLPEGSYKFAVRYQSTMYWSPLVDTPASDQIIVETGLTSFRINVEDLVGNRVQDIPVYIFTGDNIYTGVEALTDLNGAANVSVAGDDILIRADFDGQSSWSELVPTTQGHVTVLLNSCPDNQFLAEYFNNDGLSGDPDFVRCEDTIDNNWARGGPGNGVRNDNFSVRWTGRFTFTDDTYNFNTTADDGVRVYLNNSLMIDEWRPQTATSYSFRSALSAGTHDVRMEYYERGGFAVAQLGWSPIVVSCANDQFLAEYYDNRYLSGDPVHTQCESSINYNWGNGSPGYGLGRNNFSVRWTGNMTFAAGDYDFSTTTDDGVRLYVDNRLEIDAWRPQAPTTYGTRVSLSDGTHLIRMDYYERGGGAVARLSWRAP